MDRANNFSEPLALASYGLLNCFQSHGCSQALLWLTSPLPSAVNGAPVLGLGKHVASYSSLEISPCATGGVCQNVLLHPELDVCSGRNQSRVLGAMGEG